MKRRDSGRGSRTREEAGARDSGPRTPRRPPDATAWRYDEREGASRGWDRRRDDDWYRYDERYEDDRYGYGYRDRSPPRREGIDAEEIARSKKATGAMNTPPPRDNYRGRSPPRYRDDDAYRRGGGRDRYDGYRDRDRGRSLSRAQAFALSRTTTVAAAASRGA